MRERSQILEFWRQLESRNEPAVLATVVRTEGSAYRVPGARMLLARNGRRVGGISGGCLEDDVVKKAWWLTSNGPLVRRYDTTQDGDISTDGFGLGCNGVIFVLLERVQPGTALILNLLEEVNRSRKPAVVAHVIDPSERIGQKLILEPNGEVHHNLADTQFAEELASAAADLEASKRLVSTRGEIFLERITPLVRLLIFGAGDDAVSLAEVANYQGWQVSVFDGRSHYARAEKFSHVKEVIVRPLGSPAPEIDPWTVAVLMTHSYSQDLDVLRSLGGLPLRYLGVLGPKKRTAKLLEDLKAEDCVEPVALHAPMGLDLGGDGPEQVALAVVAEIQSVLQRRQGGALRDRTGPIHDDETQSEQRDWVRSIVCA
jgi:xanthine dehydrogenase accessory factor